MITTLLAKILSGACVGYITNELAIKMLFRKHFGLGGIVLRTRDEFITNISRLVEQNIINHHTLSRELSENLGAFQDSLSAALQDLTGRSLWIYLPENQLIQSVAGFDDSVKRISNEALAMLHEERLRQPLQQIIAKADLALLLTPDLMHALAQPFVRLLAHVQQTYPLLASTLTYEHVAAASWADWLTPAEYEALGMKLFQPLRQLYTVAANHNTETFFEAAQELLLNSEWLNSVAEQLRAQTLGALLGEENGKALVNTLAERLIAIINSPEGQQVLESFAQFFWEVLSREKTTVFSLLNENTAERFDLFLRGYLPVVLQKLIEWLQSRRHQLETIIDNTFRKNIKWKLQDIILQLFVGSVSQYADVVRRITDILDKHSRNPAETATLLTEQIIRFLKQNTIGQIVCQVRQNSQHLKLAADNEALSDPLAVLLAKAIIGLLQSKTDSVLQFSTLAERPLGNFISQEETVELLQQALRYLWQEQVKKRWLYAPLAGRQLEKCAYAFWAASYHCPLCKWITKEQLQSVLRLADAQLPTLLQGILWQNKSAIVRQLQAGLANVSLGNQAEQLIEAYITTNMHRLGQQPWGSARIAFESWSVTLPTRLQQVLLQNLEFLLTGRIEAVVRNSLQKMPNEKLLDLVERFMGRELKPITLLGALLGGMAGGTLAFVPDMHSDSPIAWKNTLLAAAAYGITGYGTNWLALRMIFRPYRPIQWSKGRALPFTPGVVAKNQRRFADNMGKFVAGGLLNPQNIVAIFQEKQEIIRQQVKAYVAQPELMIPANWLHNNRTAMAAALTDWAAQTLQNNSDTFREQISKRIAFISLKDLPWEKINKSAIEQLQNTENSRRLSALIVQKLVKQLQNPAPLIKLMGNCRAYAEKLVVWALPLARKTIATLTVDDLRSALLPTIRQAWQQLNKAPIGQYVSITQQERLKKRLNTALEQQLASESLRELFYKLIDGQLSQELNPNRQINELFSGKLLEVIIHNLDGILDGFITIGVSWLQENKEFLAEKVYEQAYEQNKAGAFIYKSTIKDTVIALAERDIPEFFKCETKGLKELVSQWARQLGETPLSAVGIRIDESYLKQLTDTLLGKPELREAVMRALDLLTDELMKMPMASFAHVLQIADAESLWQRTEPIVRVAWQELQAPLQRILPELLPLLVKAVQQIAEQLWSSLSPQVLTEFVGQEELGNRIEKALARYLSQNVTQDWLQDALQECQQQLITKSVGELLPTEHLALQLIELLQKLLTHKESRPMVQRFAEELLSTLLPRLPQSLAPQTLQFLADVLVNAVLETAQQHLPNIVNAVDIRKVVVREVSEMDPKEIETLFYGFAGQYFKQLINYGFGFGIAFGLIIDLILGTGLHLIAGK